MAGTTDRSVATAGGDGEWPRVVSLLPGATELVAALGVEPVGVSHECDYPPGVASLPAVTTCRIDTQGSAAAVDAAVQDAVDDGGVFDVDRERLAALDPDVVVTQAVCDVCAVDQVAVRSAVDDLDLDASVVTLDVHSLADLYEAVARLGEVLGREATAAVVIEGLRERVGAVAAATGEPAEGPEVVVLDWPEPPMVAGHWVPELVRVAGGRYPLADVGEVSRPREWATIRDTDPDVLVVAPCGFGLDRTLAHLDALRDRPGRSSLRAVREGRVYAMDDHHHVNRAGPRLVETAALLAAVVDPAALGRKAPSGLVQQVAD